MNCATHATPAGPFMVVADGDGVVHAAGWTTDPEALLALVAAPLRPAALRGRREVGAASRALEAWLDQGGPLGSRYILEVSSPGLDRPLRWPRHWTRFVGSEVQATVAGLGRIRARIVAVPDEGTVVLAPAGREARTVRLADIRDARLAVDL